MSLNVTFNGSMFIIPETGEVGWGGNTTSYLVAIAAGALQKTGGSFTLSADTDFGASFGLASLYYKSRSANLASTGIVRLNNNSDAIVFRNAANNADLPILVNASDELLYNGNQVLTGTGPSSYVSSITGTANQVIASASTGAVTLSLPQSINTAAAVQFGTLGLGSAAVASSILSLTSTTLGFLPPRLTTAERDAIAAPATGLFIYNTSTGVNNYYNGVSWVAIAAGGTINAGLQYQLGYYAAAGTTLSGLALITASRALVSDTNGLPVASTVTTTELQALAGLTASRALETSAGGLVQASSVTSTELGYLSGVTSAIQTQLNTKATDSLVVHLAGTETITGIKTFIAQGFFKSPSSGTNNVWGIKDSVDATVWNFEYRDSDGRLRINPTGSYPLVIGGSGVTIEATTNQLILGTSNTYTLNATAPSASRIITLADPGAAASLVLTEGAQTINGAKTLSDLRGTFGANIAANAFKLTGLAAGAANGESVRYEQLQSLQPAVVGTTATATTTTSTSFVSTNLTATITPSSASSRIRITITGTGGIGTNGERAVYTIQRDAVDFSNLTNIQAPTATVYMPLAITFVDSPATASPTTYTLRIRSSGGGTVYSSPNNTVETMILEEIR